MSELPYTDTKPQGAADFYFAINATFRFLLASFGKDGFVRWLQELGRSYFAPVNLHWKQGGLPAVARYWQAFFAAEPGAEVEVEHAPDQVTIRVNRCPALAHLRRGGREIVPCFCQHCYFLNQARAEAAGLSMNVEGGDGRCLHRYAAQGMLRQDMTQITEVR